MSKENENQPIPESELDEKTRAQVKKELHLRKQEERKQNAEELKIQYHEIKDSPALADILQHAKSFRNFHQKLASDGVGAKVVSDPDVKGGQRVVEYELTDSQTFRELGGASALEELITYIENKLS